MRRCHSLLLPVLLMLLLTVLALFVSCSDKERAQTGELKFELTSDKTGYKVTGIGTAKGSTIEIPESYRDMPVKMIMTGVFKGQKDLKKVILPASLTQIYASAFENCTALTDIECRSSGITMIAENAFKNTGYANNKKNYEDGGLYLANTLIAVDSDYEGDFVIRDGTYTVAYQAFKNSKIESVTIPDRLWHLGKFTFLDAKNLEKVTFTRGERSLVYLGEGVFYGCTALKSIALPTRCAKVGERAFFGCSALTEVTSLAKTETIGHAAFSGCSALTEITLPSTVKTIEDEAFLGCSALARVSGTDSLKRIGSKAFRGCSALTEISLPEGVTLGAFAFDGTPLEK